MTSGTLLRVRRASGLGLRLRVNEAGLALSEFGWHVMKRIE